MKYQLGQIVHWINSSCNYQKQIPCPMCFGKRFVTITLGDGSQIESMCGMCDRGIEHATGTATVWEPSAVVEAVTIQGISTRDGVQYEIGYRTVREHELFATQEEADIACAIELKRVKAQAEQYYKDNFRTCTKKQIWSAGYHRSCIEREERSIEWHKMRLGLIKDKVKS